MKGGITKNTNITTSIFIKLSFTKFAVRCTLSDILSKYDASYDYRNTGF